MEAFKKTVKEMWGRLTAWNGHILIMALLAGLLLVIRAVTWIFSGM